jgi:glucose/arabinose dehydrogenase
MSKNLLLTGLVAFLLAACAARGTLQPAPTDPPTAVVAPPVIASAPPPTSQSAASTVPAQPASVFPEPTGYRWAEVAAGFESPVDIQFAPDGSGRMFVVEQPGRIRIFDLSGPARGPFLDLTDRVNARGNEQIVRGWHSIAVCRERIFYVSYTAPPATT